MLPVEQLLAFLPICASSYAARSKAYQDDLKAYNQQIDVRIAREARALQKPFRHVETMAEAQARNIAARAAREGLGALAASVVSVVSGIASAPLSSGDDDAFDLGEVTDVGSATTSLGDAAPFEYVKSVTSGTSDTLAGVFLTPSEESECMFQYDADMTECSAWYAAKPTSWGMCKQRAADRLGRCLAGKGEIF